MRKGSRFGKMCAWTLTIAMSFQSAFAYELSSAESLNEQQNSGYEQTIATPSQIQLMAAQATTPAIIKVESGYNALVRSGKYAAQTAKEGHEFIPRERLDAKTTLTDVDGSRKGYMMFDVPNEVDWDSVGSIQLTLYLNERMGKDVEDTIEFYATDTPSVEEENMTWNNSPTLQGKTKIGEVKIGGGGTTIKEINKEQWIEVDVTTALKNHFKAQPAGQRINLTVCMSDPTQSDQGGAKFWSKYKDAGKYTPYLNIFTQNYEDTLAPKLVVTDITDNMEAISKNISFKIEAVDNHDTVPKIAIKVNGNSVPGIIGTNQVTLITGNNTIEVSASDAANNIQAQTYHVKSIQSNKFLVTKDTFIRKNEPDKFFGTNAELMLKNPVGASSDRRLYFSFDLQNYKKEYVREAKIYFYATKIMGNDRISQDVLIYETPEFDDKTLTWNTAPKDQETYIGKDRTDRSGIAAGADKPVNKYFGLDITKYINDKLTKGETLGKLSFALRAEENDQTGWYVASREAGESKSPYLQIVEGLPNPTLQVSGIEDKATYTSETIENVSIKASSMNDTIKVDVEVKANGGASIVAKSEGVYDIPLDKIGENNIQIVAKDPTGNTVTQKYTVTKLAYLDAATYYVDSMGGNDANDGLSEAKPWKTLAKLNSGKFKPGTSILFKRGGIWNGQFKPKGSGVEGSPIIVNAYGNGAKPIINGNGISSKDTGSVFSEATVQLTGLSYWEVNNLEVTNAGPITPGDTSVRRAGIMVLSPGYGELDHIYIKDCYVHDVEVECETSKSYKPYNGGILFVGDTRDEQGNDTKVVSGFNDVLVEGCHIKNVDFEGLRLANKLNGGDQRDLKTNDKVVFRNNLIEDVHGDGIVISGVGSGGLVEKNIIRRHSTCPITLNYAGCWVIYSDGVVFQYNEVYDGVHGYKDGEAFDFDMGAPNTLFQYNYSHHNKGGFLLTMTTAGANNVFRYNISQNDGNGNEIFFCANLNDEAWIYNNTVYVGEGVTANYLINENNLDRVHFKNNIVKVDGTIKKFSQVTKPYTGLVENNCIYPASILSLPGAPSNIASNITVDPMLTDPSGANIQMDTWDQAIWEQNIGKFKLKEGSACIDAGQKIPNAGPQDIYGTSLDIDGFTDIGAHEYTGNKILVESITLDKVAATIKRAPSEGCELQLKATAAPANAMNKRVKWSTSDPRIASVDQTGKVKGQLEGTATITVKTLDGSNKAASCAVTVEKGDYTGPLLSFQVIADAHLDNSSVKSTRAVALSNALKEMKTLAPESAGVVLLGDNVTSGSEAEYQGLGGILNNPTYNPLQYYPLIGNHEVRWLKGGFQEAEERFQRYFNRDKVYYDEWLNGYHFIMLGTEKDLKDDAYISNEQWSWFEQKLAEHADASAPIFVFLHQPLKVGFYESDAFNVGDRDLEMKHLLAKYPQVIYMSGHSHNAFGKAPGQKYDEKYCTMIDVPGFEASGEGYYVEVYADKVLMKGRNFKSKTWVPAGSEGNYEIALPAQIPATDLLEPTWASGNLDVALDKQGCANLSWTAAEDNVGVVEYRILRNDVPYAYVEGQTTTFKDDKLFKGSSYTFSIQARDEENRWSTKLVAASPVRATRNSINAGAPSKFDRSLLDNMMAYIDFENNYADQSGHLTPKLRRGTIAYTASPYGTGAKYDSSPEGLILGDIDYGKQDFTVSFWLNSTTTNYNGGPVIVSNSRFASRKNPGWVAAMTSGGKLWYNLAIPNQIQVDDPGTSNIVISNGKWQYVTISTDRTNKKVDIYLNGEKKITHDITALRDVSLNTQFPTIIGKDGDGVNYGTPEFVIDEFFMTKQAVTDTQAKTMYNAYQEDPIVAVESIILSEVTLEMTKNITYPLIATVLPENASNKDVTWVSSDIAVATVDETGLVTAKQEGTTRITATTVEGDFVATCQIVVTKIPEVSVPVEGIQLSTKLLALTEQEVSQLQRAVLPETATNKGVTWMSSNQAVATVNAVGLVTAKQEGIAIITATTIDGNFTATCEVRVKKKDLGSNGSESNGSGSGSSSSKPSNESTSETSRDKTIQEQWNSIKEDAKKEIEKKVKEALPYTLLAKNYTIEELDKLTNNQFTNKQLEEIKKDMSILKDLGININSQVVELKNVENPEFKDILENHWAYKDIKALAKIGIVMGDEEGKFKPKEALTVGDTFTFLDRMLLLKGVTQAKLSNDTVEKYITNKESWAYYPTLSVSSKLTENTLNVIAKLEDKPLSRALLAQVLYEVTNGKLDKTNPLVAFKDIQTTNYKDALDYCIATGLLKGTSATTISPEKSVTRAEMMVILQRLDILLVK